MDDDELDSLGNDLVEDFGKDMPTAKIGSKPMSMG
jgi:hypothetical protein